MAPWFELLSPFLVSLDNFNRWDAAKIAEVVLSEVRINNSGVCPEQLLGILKAGFGDFGPTQHPGDLASPLLGA